MVSIEQKANQEGASSYSRQEFVLKSEGRAIASRILTFSAKSKKEMSLARKNRAGKQNRVKCPALLESQTVQEPLIRVPVCPSSINACSEQGGVGSWEEGSHLLPGRGDNGGVEKKQSSGHL